METKRTTHHEYKSQDNEAFLKWCEKKGVKPTARQVSKYRRKPPVMSEIPNNTKLHEIYESWTLDNYKPKPQDKKRK